MPEDLKKSDKTEESRPVPSQAEGDEETIDKSLAQKEQKKDQSK